MEGISLGPYEITEMIIDDDFYGQETVTAHFTYKQENYSITFNKGDLEVLNAWVLKKDASLPANLSNIPIGWIRKAVDKEITDGHTPY
ncbi:hypothetical protein [Mesobacillus foraminis]|uniref:hypothetical protein n=1 Tax=Mesobacillus foraminis TaxID=279826 RepID=UPI00214B5F02|nr:hypothetical protein [Mesobacillus foraminis]